MKKKSNEENLTIGEINTSDDFHASLAELKEEDIPIMTEKKMKKNRKKMISNIIQLSFLAVCAVALVVCAVLLIKNLHDKKRGESVYDGAASVFVPVTIGDSAGNEDKGASPVQNMYDRISALYEGGGLEEQDTAIDLDLAPMKASLSSLRQTNSDVIGWIYVEDSKINYPLMQSSNGNDEYYLTHAYNGEYLAVGSIYLTSSCDKKLNNNYNSLIYGHNVVNGSMFHDVLKFLDPEFFESKYVYIYTLDGAYIYKPFAIYETRSDYNYIQTYFASEREFFDFAERVAANSEVPCSVEFAPGDTIITLSTCTNGGVGGPGRYAFHAKLVAFVN